MVPLGDVRWPPQGAGDKENHRVQVRSITAAVARSDGPLPARRYCPAVQQLSHIIVSHALKITGTKLNTDASWEETAFLD